MRKFLPFFLMLLLQPGCINQTILPVVDPLPSWNNTPVKEAIIRYIQQISDPHSFLFTDTADRIAVFDFDGTIMIEKPDYLQKAFSQTYPGFISSPAVYDTVVAAWYETTRHPRLKQRFQDCIYQPMIELLHFFESHQVKNFICSGSDQDFIRIVARVCHLPSERIIGTTYQLRVDTLRNEILRTEDIHTACWKSGKIESLYHHIGKKPLIVIGNSDGDIPMIQYAGTNPRPSLKILLIHDDAVREYAYFQGAEVAIRTAKAEHWIMVSMKDDFRNIYAFELGGKAGNKMETMEDRIPASSKPHS